MMSFTSGPWNEFNSMPSGKGKNSWEGASLWNGGGNSEIFYVHLYLVKWSNLTDMFQRGWFNHQRVHGMPRKFLCQIPTRPIQHPSKGAGFSFGPWVYTPTQNTETPEANWMYMYIFRIYVFLFTYIYNIVSTIIYIIYVMYRYIFTFANTHWHTSTLFRFLPRKRGIEGKLAARFDLHSNGQPADIRTDKVPQFWMVLPWQILGKSSLI